jgi:single-strand DNA-binding protein
MASYNRVILLGNLTRDPELRYIPSGQAVSDLGLAVNHRYKNASGEWVDEATFVDVTVWARSAEIANEYLSKGSPVLIEGRLKLDMWEKDGQKHSKMRVVCERLTLVGSRGDGGGQGGGQGGAQRTGARPARSQGSSQQGPPPDDPGEYGAPEYSSAGSRSDAPSGHGEADIPF